MSKLIAITGNSKDKTLFAYLMGLRLAINGHRTILLCTDQSLPSLQLILPRQKSPDRKSLGAVLAEPMIDAKVILEHMIPSRQNSNLSTLSYAPDETGSSYPHILESDVSRMISELQTVVNYILADTQPSGNEVDACILKMCDKELCATTADVNGVAYRQANRRRGEATQVLLQTSPSNPLEDVLATFARHPRYQFPFEKGLLSAYNGMGVEGMSVSKKYIKALETLLQKEVLA